MKNIPLRVWWLSLGVEVGLIVAMSILAGIEKPALSGAEKNAQLRLLHSLAQERQLLSDQARQGKLTTAFVGSEDNHIDEQAAEHRGQL